MTNNVRAVFTEIAVTAESESSDWEATRYDRIARNYSYDLPENAISWENMSALKRAVTESGSHYFDPAAIRQFRARTDAQLFGGRFWVESRKYVPGPFSSDETVYPREYMVAYATQYTDDRPISIERVGRYLSLNDARKAAKRLCEAVDSSGWIAGWNMPGYLPETDPEPFTFWGEAWEYLRDTVDRFKGQDEELPGCCPDDSLGCEACVECVYGSTLAAFDAVKRDDSGTAFSVMHGENELVFWIASRADVE